MESNVIYTSVINSPAHSLYPLVMSVCVFVFFCVVLEYIHLLVFFSCFNCCIYFFRLSNFNQTISPRFSCSSLLAPPGKALSPPGCALHHILTYFAFLTTVFFARSCFLSSIDRIFFCFACFFFHNNIISNNRNNYFRIPSVCMCLRRVCLC